MRAKPYGDPRRKVHDVGESNEATQMCNFAIVQLEMGDGRIL